MKTLICTLFFSFFFSSIFNTTDILFAQTIYTIAGNNIHGYSGNGGPAIDAELYYPTCIDIDANGNAYFADCFNNVIRMINTSGIITTVVGNGYNAGTGHGGYSGDGGPAIDAELANPDGIAIDSIGDIYIADFHNDIVRKVDTMGIITTVAGNYSLGEGYTGNGGPATSAQLNYPAGLALDAKGNLYIADCDNACVREVNKAGIISTVAGMSVYSVGYSGDGGPATDAQLNTPTGLCFDKIGNLYIADCFNNVIRKVDTAGIITTVAGNHSQGYSGDGGPATSAELWLPFDIFVDQYQNLYIADAMNNVIREVDTAGIISTIIGNGYDAGTGEGGYSGNGGPAIDAELFDPQGVFLDVVGNIYVADADNNVIREVTKNYTGINELKTNSGISVYPNPNNGIFNFLIDNSQLTMENESIEIYNMMGEQVYSNSYQLLANGYQPMTIDLTGQPSGVYFYRVLSEDGRLEGEGKIVVQK